MQARSTVNFVKSVSRNVCIGLVLATAVSASAQAVEWKGWNIHKPDYPNTVALDKFAELLDERFNGDITLKLFHSGVLGNQPWVVPWAMCLSRKP